MTFSSILLIFIQFLYSIIEKTGKSSLKEEQKPSVIKNTKEITIGKSIKDKKSTVSLSEYGSESESGSNIDRTSPTFLSTVSPVKSIFEQSITFSPKPLIKPVPIVKGNSSSFKYSTDDIPLSGRMFDHTNPREIKPFVCVSCNCGFGEISSIRAHARHSHARNGITNELFSCAYCCSTFATIDTLKYHFDICKQKLQNFSNVFRPQLTTDFEGSGMEHSSLKRSSSSDFTSQEKRMRILNTPASPGSLSTSSDKTYDRIFPEYYKQYNTTPCPPDCRCPAAQYRNDRLLAHERPSVPESRVVQERYLAYLEHCQHLLNARMEWMQAMKSSRR